MVKIRLRRMGAKSAPFSTELSLLIPAILVMAVSLRKSALIIPGPIPLRSRSILSVLMLRIQDRRSAH